MPLPYCAGYIAILPGMIWSFEEQENQASLSQAPDFLVFPMILKRRYAVRIYVDADACPVKGIIVRLAKEFSIPVTMVSDTSHELQDGYSTVVTVDKSHDSADLALINLAGHGDIVVTQDYGVAAMALAKSCHPIHQNGVLYTSQNIDRLLFERHLGQKMRRSGKKTHRNHKRTAEDDRAFEKALFDLLCSLCGLRKDGQA